MNEIEKCDNCGKDNQGTVGHNGEHWCYDCMRLAGYCLSCDCHMPDIIDDYYNYEHDECPGCYNKHNPHAAVTAKEE